MNDNLYNRTSFSYREKETAVWIAEELLAMGYDWDAIEIQEFSRIESARLSWFGTRQWYRIDLWVSEDAYNNARDYSQNVILTVPGQSEKKIIVGAHYDTWPYPGASDNASGVALLLESAQRMLTTDNYYTIVYVFFGAEEVGLMGAYFYYDSLSQTQRDNIIMMINADVLFEGPYLVYGAGYAVDNTPRQNHISRQVSAVAGEINIQHYADIISYPENIFRGSDHLVFLWEGHTVVYIAGYYQNYEGDFTIRLLHSYRDCIHYINENWPGKIETNMRYFSLFLEGLLTNRYTN